MSSRQTKKQKAYSRGRKGERLAAFVLRLKGYKILKHRYKTHIGEADLVARRKTTLVFAEVKARNSLEDGLESITPHLRKRVTNAARYYLSEHPELSGLDIRFDVIVILPGARLKHLKDAWQT